MKALTSLMDKQDFGLLLLRLGLGVSMLSLGVLHLMGGADALVPIGHAMEVFGLSGAFFSIGLLVSLLYIISGAFMVFGFFARLAYFLLFLINLGILLSQLRSGASFQQSVYLISTNVLFFCLMFIGPGNLTCQKD